MKAQHTLISIAFAVVLVTATVSAATAPPAPKTGGIAPRFVSKSVDGQRLDLAALLERGPVLLDFWATSCKPCLTAMPRLQSLHRELSLRGLTVIGISVDGTGSSSRVTGYTRKLGVTYPIVLDENGKLQRLYHPKSLPTSILIGPSGTIANVIEGYREGDSDRLRLATLALMGPVTDSTGMMTAPAPKDAADTLRNVVPPPTE